VLISDMTRRLSRNEFTCLDFGRHQLKGLTEPLQVWRVLSTGAATVAPEVVSPLVGRAAELGLLNDRWQRAQAGEGLGMLLQGDPGMGKSRLCHAIQEVARAAGAQVLVEGCSQIRSGSPFMPVARMMAQASGVGLHSGAQGTAGLSLFLRSLGLEEAELLPYLLPLLSLPLPDGLVVQEYSAQAQREKTFGALLRVVQAMTTSQPLMLVLEDLQWADPSTLDWVARLLQRQSQSSLMLVCTARADFQHGGALPLETLTLGPCSEEDLALLVQAQAGPDPFSPQVVEKIVRRAGGVPLFAQELARSMRETQGSEVPATLQDLLMTKLDRLGPGRSVAQQAAVIGRVFSFDMLQAVTGLDREALRSALLQAVGLGLIVAEDAVSADRYRFLHGLFEDIAYQSMLRDRRQQAHRRTAMAIGQLHPAVIDRQPEVLAHHFGQAGMPAEAVAHWLKAGRLALARSACLEAVAHVDAALVLLENLPPASGRHALALELHLVRAPALMAVQGAAAAEVEQAYIQAGEACVALGETPKLIVPLWGLWAYALMRGQLRRALEWAQQIGRLAQRQQAGDASLIASETMGMTCFYMGRFEDARNTLRDGRQRPTDSRQDGRRGRAVHDAGIMCDAFQALVAWLMGDGLEVEECLHRVRLGERALGPYDRAYVHCFFALLSMCRDRPQDALEHAAEALTISRSQGFPTWAALANLLRGWGLAHLGQTAQGVAAARKGCAAWDAAGAINLAPFFRTVLADTLLQDGQPAQALASLDEALAYAASEGERWWEAETLRLRAKALRMFAPHDPSAAVECLHLALQVASEQRAAVLEARARADIEGVAL
jgi:tetratricopeptide (TPR) repeat protein